MASPLRTTTSPHGTTAQQIGLVEASHLLNGLRDRLYKRGEYPAVSFLDGNLEMHLGSEVTVQPRRTQEGLFCRVRFKGRDAGGAGGTEFEAPIDTVREMDAVADRIAAFCGPRTP